MAVRIIAMGLGTLQGILLVLVILQGTVLTAQVSAAGNKENGTEITASQTSVLEQLEPQAWNDLTARQRLDILQTVANVERTNLGLPHELNVAAEEMEEGLLGYYQDNIHQIMVSTDMLLHGTPGALVEVICHEAYHGYQHRLTELYAAAPAESRSLQLLQPAERYAWEFQHYKDGEDDYDAYYDQVCESDARTYAKERILSYETLTGLVLADDESGTSAGE